MRAWPPPETVGLKSVFRRLRLRYPEGNAAFGARLLRIGIADRWRITPLLGKFVTIGGIVMLIGMAAIGNWITGRIEQAVVANTAATAALYAESFVAPLSQELAAGGRLSYPAERALEEVLTATTVGERIVSFKIWGRGGRVLYASDPDIIGRSFEPSPSLRRAWTGEVSGSLAELADDESAAEASLGIPLLEVYSPIHEIWSGDVIAVAEFYEVAHELKRDLADARRTSWLLVAGVFLASGLLLSGIVRAGGRTIERQEAVLREQIAASHQIAEENAALRRRAIDASARAAAQVERNLRRVSADLHDGPAQYVALAAMRLDSIVPETEAGRHEAEVIGGALRNALAEIRAISRGLSLPDLERLGLREVVQRALDAHPGHDGRPSLDYAGPEAPDLGLSATLCIYRFLQEGLSNAARHACGAPVAVEVRVGEAAVTARVRDEGPGFDQAAGLPARPDGGEGLAGLRDRAESIGGELDIVTAAGAGTRLVLTLPISRGDTA